MKLEVSDRRILGAIRLRDGTTGMAIYQPLQVAAAGVRLTRNLSGDYVITAAPGFPDLQAHLTRWMQPPPTPAIESVEIELQVSDQSGRYLPRRATLRLPRDPDANAADQPHSLFQPIDIPLFPSPSAPTQPGWAVMRTTVRETETNQRLPWALIQVMRDGAAPALSQADERGEALVAVADIPVRVLGGNGNSVLATEVSVTLAVKFDTQLQKITDGVDGLTLPPNNRNYIPDPSLLASGGAGILSGSISYQLAAGRDHINPLFVSLS